MNRFYSEDKKLAILIDPSSIGLEDIVSIVERADKASVNFIFVGGSLMSNCSFESVIIKLKSLTNIPIIIFPGSSMQVSRHADAILFLSLISGRNPDLLIGNQVITAPIIKAFNIPTISVGYILIDGGIVSSVQYMSGTMPIPSNKTEIAVCTAMAGEMLGLKSIYLEAGSGAISPISAEMIVDVKKNISVPLIVGGGIRDAEQARKTFIAGADIIVVGNILEKNVQVIDEISEVKIEINSRYKLK